MCPQAFRKQWGCQCSVAAAVAAGAQGVVMVLTRVVSSHGGADTQAAAVGREHAGACMQALA
jgi:hypothetical protein